MASGPLDGTRVLEFTQIVAGPLGCQLLSDLGAEVIKVEPVNGEAWRYAGAFLPAESKWFHSLNRGKKSLAINITDPQAQEAIHRLVRDIDVVVINYRPDVATRLGIDYETLAALNPGLIYVDNTAFGREGAFASRPGPARPGYDIVVQALCGLIATGGKLNDDGVPVSGQPPIADTTTGYAIAVAVCAALFYRGKTGKGQKIETSLMINALMVNNVHFASIPAADADARAQFAQVLAEADEKGALYGDLLAANEAKSALTRPGNIYYRCFLTSDGAIAIGALSADLRVKVKHVLEVDHNRYDPSIVRAFLERPELATYLDGLSNSLRALKRDVATAHQQEIGKSSRQLLLEKNVRLNQAELRVLRLSESARRKLIQSIREDERELAGLL